MTLHLPAIADPTLPTHWCLFDGQQVWLDAGAFPAQRPAHNSNPHFIRDNYNDHHVIAEQGGRREMGSSGGGGRFGLSYFDDAMVQTYVDEAVANALTNLEARPAPAGEMVVVLGAGWPGILLHEAVGHGLEGDFNRKGSSAFAGKIGQQVASPACTIVDDGTLADRRGSLNIDDEGTPSQRTLLIDANMRNPRIHDLFNLPDRSGGLSSILSAISSIILTFSSACLTSSIPPSLLNCSPLNFTSSRFFS